MREEEVIQIPGCGVHLMMASLAEAHLTFLFQALQILLPVEADCWH